MSDLWSNDEGFDPLVRHIKTRGNKRRRDGQARPAPAPQRPVPAHAQAVADLLKRSGKNKRPRKRATLANHLAKHFHKKQTAEEIERAVEQLRQAGMIAEWGRRWRVTFS